MFFSSLTDVYLTDLHSARMSSGFSLRAMYICIRKAMTKCDIIPPVGMKPGKGMDSMRTRGFFPWLLMVRYRL